MKITTCLATGLLFCSAGFANENTPGTWDSVTFKVTYEESKASVKLERAEDKLASVLLSLNGKLLEIPAAEIADIENPLLESAQLLFGEGYYGPVEDDEEAVPHCVIEVAFGERSSFGKHSLVKFLFHSGAYQQRTVLIQDTETVWKNYLKYPGEAAMQVGTTTFPPDRPGPSTPLEEEDIEEEEEE